MRVAMAMTSRIRDGRRQGATITSKLMADYLVKRNAEVAVVDQPIRTEPDIRPTVSLYVDGEIQEVKRWRTPKWFKDRHSLLMIADGLACLWYLGDEADMHGRIDLFIGYDVVNMAVGWVLKKVGDVDKLAYAVTDFSQNRTGSRFQNWVYRKLDSFGVRHADFILNTTEKDKGDRGVVSHKGTDFNMPSLCPPVMKENFSPRSGNDVVYLGALEERFGVDKIIQAMPLILAKIPDARLHIIGSGSQRNHLEGLAASSEVTWEAVEFYGFLPDEEAEALLRKMRVGVAPYVVNEKLGMLHNLDSAKIRYYAWCGVPSVVSTQTPQVVDLVNRFQCGFPTDIEPEKLAEAVVFMLKDEEAYSHAMAGCMKLASFYDAERYFDGLFSMMEGKSYTAETTGPERVTVFSK